MEDIKVEVKEAQREVYVFLRIPKGFSIFEWDEEVYGKDIVFISREDCNIFGRKLRLLSTDPELDKLLLEAADYAEKLEKLGAKRAIELEKVKKELANGG